MVLFLLMMDSGRYEIWNHTKIYYLSRITICSDTMENFITKFLSRTISALINKSKITADMQFVKYSEITPPFPTPHKINQILIWSRAKISISYVTFFCETFWFSLCCGRWLPIVDTCLSRTKQKVNLKFPDNYQKFDSSSSDLSLKAFLS